MAATIGVVATLALWLGGSRSVDVRADSVTRSYGALDIELTVGDDADPTRSIDQHLGALDDELRHSSVPSTDGLLTATTARVTLRAGDRRLDDCISDVNLASARRFGPDPELTGAANAPRRIRVGEILLTESGANRLDAEVGHTVSVDITDESSTEFTVAAIVPAVGAFATCSGVVADGEFETMGAEAAQATTGRVWMSADGGADNPAQTARAHEALQAKFESRQWVDISLPKLDGVSRAEQWRPWWNALAAVPALGGLTLGAALLIRSRLIRSRLIRSRLNRSGRRAEESDH